MTYPPPQGNPSDNQPPHQPPVYQQPPSYQQAPQQPPGYQQPQNFGQQGYQQQNQPGPGYGSPTYYQQQSVAQTNPADHPSPGVGMGQALKLFFKKYATFSGRASRSEYWFVALGMFLITLIPQIMVTVGLSIAAQEIATKANTTYAGMDVETILNDPQLLNDLLNVGALGTVFTLGAALLSLISLVTFIPSLALLWRRLHDTNHSGAFFLLSFIPVVGTLILLFFLVSSSNPAGQRFDRPSNFR